MDQRMHTDIGIKLLIMNYLAIHIFCFFSIHAFIDVSIDELCKENLPLSQSPQHRTKFEWIDRFGDVNWVSSSNFFATTLRFFEKFDHPFSHVFIYACGNKFSRSQGFVALPVTSCIKDTCLNLSLSKLVKGTATKPCKNGSSNSLKNC